MEIKMSELQEILCNQNKTKANEPSCDSPYVIGQAYLFRLVTHHQTGIVKKVYHTEILLEQAAWIPDDGRYHKALRDSEFKEVEPVPDGVPMIIGRGALIDAVPIDNVPREVK